MNKTLFVGLGHAAYGHDETECNIRYLEHLYFSVLCSSDLVLVAFLKYRLKMTHAQTNDSGSFECNYFLMIG